MQDKAIRPNILAKLSAAYLLMAALTFIATLDVAFVVIFFSLFFGAMGADPLFLCLMGLAILPPIVISLLNISLYVGTKTREPWAWKVGVVTQIITLVLAIPTGLLFGGSLEKLLLLILALLAGGSLYMLSTPDVRKALGKL
jgi:hypothetical protein